MHEALKQKVFEANMELPAKGLVTYTWGNASEIDRASGHIIIKPSGVAYETMKASDMVVMDLNGNRVEGDLKPSSDFETHLEFYLQFPDIGGVVHTHSTWATAWAQACREIPLYGTTQADYFCGPIMVTRELTDEEIAGEYERNTGRVIMQALKDRGYDPLYNPAVIVANHGPFTWGKDAHEAVHNAVVLEEIAKMATLTEQINPKVKPAKNAIKDKHFYRKHGKDAYYGQ